jgi:hypothetical protein
VRARRGTARLTVRRCASQAGKSTLLKLMFGELSPTEGEVRKHTHLRIAKYHQHSTDQVRPPNPLAHCPARTRPRFALRSLSPRRSVRPCAVAWC